eukprot:gene16047-55143_t
MWMYVCQWSLTLTILLLKHETTKQAGSPIVLQTSEAFLAPFGMWLFGTAVVLWAYRQHRGHIIPQQLPPVWNRVGHCLGLFIQLMTMFIVSSYALRW